jgi:hypothetical protein
MKTIFIIVSASTARRGGIAGLVVSAIVVMACSQSAGGSSTKDSTEPTRPPLQTLKATLTSRDTSFVTRDHFVAGVEMQLSGEPFAQSMGRILAGYSRDFFCQGSICSPDMYHDPALNNGVAGGPVGRIDIAGYSSAVESYEYSKQPMNNLAFESGAGTSLAFGPVINPSRATGSLALQGLRAWEQQLAGDANTTAHNFSTTTTSDNPIGWPGFWPTLEPFTQWDPAIQPSNVSTGCTISSDDDPGATGALHCDDYECNYSSATIRACIW